MPIIDLPQGRVQYRLAGPANSADPPVVFVHGLLVNSELWTGVADELAKRGVRSYAPDLPLGAHSMALRPDADLSPRGLARLILEFLEALELTDVTLVGNDTGMALCQFVVDTDDSRIGRLVLTNGDAFELFPPPSFEPVLKLGRRPAGVYTVLSLMRPTWLRQRIHGQNVSKPLDPELTRRWITPALADSGVRRDVAKVMRAIDETDMVEVSERLQRFTKPVVLVWGDADQFFPIELAERLRDTFPDARLVQIPGGRLFFALDEPQRVADGIAAALQPRH
ncbi:MAG TPA: alpha/beta hydrolase [Mycobacterium sp.]|jgi:pimeloyl-ACP methyl ester carboxylesterase|nr:alpha/beta hydrolase [Mycobacterium sp.]HEX4587531.1 alpha/beta hydrolase [Mycobacterium sp.]